MSYFYKLISIITIFTLLPLSIPQADAQEVEIRDIEFPTERSVTFVDDFGDARTGHSHEGNDLMGEHMTPLYAAVDGTISSINIPEASWGYALTIKDSDGYTYHYLHINNDTPGTDDGNGGLEYAYAPGIARRVKVTRGQLVGWMGDSGNAENAGNHLHFEIRKPDKTAINPYPSLMAALTDFGTYDYDPEIARLSSADINADKGLVHIAMDDDEDPPCESGSLVKSTSTSAVYYCGANAKRYVFPNDRIYFSWYEDFDDVVSITAEELAAIPLGGNVTYRPGSRMVKIESVPDVYAVDKGGILRWIPSQSAAIAIYGEDWADQVDDLSIAFFGNYKIGEKITRID